MRKYRGARGTLISLAAHRLGIMAEGPVVLIVTLIVLLSIEGAMFSALNPILVSASSAFGLIGLLFPIVVWAGPPLALSYLIVESSRSGSSDP